MKAVRKAGNLTPTFRVIEADPIDCHILIDRLRPGHINALLGAGRSPLMDLRRDFDHSCIRRAWLIDGTLAGLGGVVGTRLSINGWIWLGLTDEAPRYPVEIVKEARRQIAEFLGTFQILTTTISLADPAARRFARFMGFVDRPDIPAPDGTVAVQIRRPA